MQNDRLRLHGGGGGGGGLVLAAQTQLCSIGHNY